jgi:hypothetical protein
VDPTFPYSQQNSLYIVAKPICVFLCVFLVNHPGYNQLTTSSLPLFFQHTSPQFRPILCQNIWLSRFLAFLLFRDFFRLFHSLLTLSHFCALKLSVRVLAPLCPFWHLVNPPCSPFLFSYIVDFILSSISGEYTVHTSQGIVSSSVVLFH